MTVGTGAEITATATVEFKYWAFISYSHADAAWAQWLHRALEAYRIPRRLRRVDAGPEQFPRRLYPIFRDRDELPTAANLSVKIREALAASRCLIVICSPRSAVSRWVDQEIRSFRDQGGSSRVLCLIVDGEPHADRELGQLECFAPTLLQDEPLAADVRAGKDSRDAAKLKLVAGIIGVNFDDLRQRERRRLTRRRLHFGLAGAASLAVLFAAYVTASDAGLALPGRDAVQLELDHYRLSPFRPVHSMAQINQAARLAVPPLIDRMNREWLSGIWLRLNPTRPNGRQMAISPWVTSEAVYSVLLNIDAHDPKLPDFIKALDAPIEPGLPIEAGSQKFGWLVSDADFPEAEPALVTLAALGAALARRDLLNDEQRAHFLARLDYTQTVADLYRPVDDGGWNMYPQQDDPAGHATFTTAMALVALLELHRAGIGWHGDEARREHMIGATLSWLVGQFDAKSNPPGWHPWPRDDGHVIDGLTLQIYAELLRAEAEDEITLPTELSLAIAAQVERLVGRPADYPTATSTVTKVFTNYDGVRLTRWQDVSFPWQAWAVDLADRWLERARRNAAPPEVTVRAQRALGYLLVDLEPPLLKDAESGATPTFVASEFLEAFAPILKHTQ